MNETKTRSMVKAVSWRIVATSITVILAYMLTGKTDIALKLGALDLVVKLLAYFLHERLWGIIKLGRKEHPLEQFKVKRELEDNDKEIIKEKLEELGYLDD
ncbi:MAG: DUF2061 domain-containing protein [bacterium]|nr:DUF2061 domain-containing protein [bacterium]